MDLRTYLLSLLSPYHCGDELHPGVVLEDATTELGLRFRLQVAGQRLWVDVALLSAGHRYAARSLRFGFGYRTEGGRNPIDSKVGERVCRRVAAIVGSNEEHVLAQISAASVVEQVRASRRVRRVEVASLLELAGTTDVPFYTVSPYMGCTIGCRFCYAQSNLAAVRRLVSLPEAPWGSYVDVRANAAAVLADELERHHPLPIKFCPIVSDPYQAIEAREKVTQACLTAISESSQVWPTMLLTRSTLILRDLPLIASLANRGGAAREHNHGAGDMASVFVGVSLPTVDDAVRDHFEPRAASVEQRLDILKQFRRAGVSTGAIVQPLLPGPLEQMADILAEHVDSVSIDVLRGVEGAVDDFADAKYRRATDPDWQMERALALREKLVARGVSVWRGELPEMMQLHVNPGACASTSC